MRISKNFKLEEFACKGECCCGNSAPISLVLVDALEELRFIINRPIIINSGFRCNRHNNDIGGVNHSVHTLGLASDIKVKGFDGPKLLQYVKKIKEFNDSGIGVYENFIHVDVLSGKRYWDKTKDNNKKEWC